MNCESPCSPHLKGQICTYAMSGPLSVLLRAVLPHLRVRHGHPGRAPPRRQAGLAQPPLRPRGVSKDDGGRQVGGEVIQHLVGVTCYGAC